MLKVGIVGNGGIAAPHKAAYKKLGCVTVEAYCDALPANLEDLQGRCYTDIDEMLKAEQGKLDFVDICLPTFLHAEVAIKAMETGFHVLCEKPMALTREDCQAMLETSRRTGKKLMIAHCNRFLDAVKLVKQIIISGELGAVLSADFHRDSAITRLDSWLCKGALSGGALIDTHIHDVDLIRSLFGMPDAVSVAAASVITDGGYDTMSVNYSYENGPVVHATCSWVLPHNKFNSRCLRVNFEKGYIFCDRTVGREAFQMVTTDGTVTDLAKTQLAQIYYDEIAYFADCIAGNKEVVLCPPEEAADAIAIAMAEVRSADAGGKKIKIGG